MEIFAGPQFIGKTMEQLAGLSLSSVDAFQPEDITDLQQQLEFIQSELQTAIAKGDAALVAKLDQLENELTDLINEIIVSLPEGDPLAD